MVFFCKAFNRRRRGRGGQRAHGLSYFIIRTPQWGIYLYLHSTAGHGGWERLRNLPVATALIMEQPGLIPICWAPKATCTPLLMGEWFRHSLEVGRLAAASLLRVQRSSIHSLGKADSLNRALCHVLVHERLSAWLQFILLWSSPTICNDEDVNL